MRNGKIRIGIVGVRRGSSFAREAGELPGLELVALCDSWEPELKKAGKRLDVVTYTDYDRFLEHEMDAVVLANYFHQHAPFAVKALQAGLHVMSETMACGKVSEGVALARAVEESGKVYMLAENYPYFAYNQEMRRLYRTGEVGEMQYGEGEYVHAVEARQVNELSPGLNHWRNWLPAAYYSSHALAPVMFISDTRPVSVNALAIPPTPADENRRLTARRGDPAWVILCRMNNGAVVRTVGTGLRGQGNWYRIHGTRGLMENLRTGNREMLRVVHESWDKKPGDVPEKIYLPEFPEQADLARKTGHGGGDFFTTYHFARAIRTGEQPYLNVYRALELAMVGIQGWRSCLAAGAPFEIPDFRKESVRKKYENDRWSPWPEDRGPGQPPPSIKGFNEPGRKAVAAARKIWRKMGWSGK